MVIPFQDAVNSGENTPSSDQYVTGYIILTQFILTCRGFTICWDNAQTTVHHRHEWVPDQENFKLWALAYLAKNRVPYPAGPQLPLLKPTRVSLEAILPDMRVWETMYIDMIQQVSKKSLHFIKTVSIFRQYKLTLIQVKEVLLACLPFLVTHRLPLRQDHLFEAELAIRTEMVSIHIN
eukprot:GHVO01056209.1.p1 GENE.GHVO01056209.1~~GHVO01056209.1.p1  ORF type:complete len:179 (+),score=5.88 GHVO01056209.1:211-747(+)